MKIPLALSFDDILLVPQRSEIESRSEVSLKTEIAPGFYLDVPISAANMDSLVGPAMAIAISKKGGIAFYPRFDSPEIQAGFIEEIKRAGGRVWVFGTII